MEPATDLSILKDWEAFKPSTKDYVAAEPASGMNAKKIMELLEGVDDLQGEGSLTGQFHFENSPDPGIILGQKPLRLPFTEADHDDLRQNSTKGRGIFTVDAEKIQLRNPGWGSVIMKGALAALADMSAYPASTWDYKLASINSVDALCTQTLDLSPKFESHFATLLVVLPTPVDLVSSLKSQHGRLNETHDIRSGPFSMAHLTLYTGIEEVVLSTADGLICYLEYHLTTPNLPRPCLRNLVGSVQGIADAFSAWSLLLNDGNGMKATITDNGLNFVSYQLNEAYTSDTTASDLTDPSDQVVLLHLSPPAKYYGFKILLAHVRICVSRTWRESHDYKDHDRDYEEEGFELLGGGGDAEVETEWQVTDLWGRKMSCDDMEAIENLNKEIKGKKVRSPLNCRIDFYDDGDMDVELSVDDEGIYEDLLTLSGTMEASFLIIVPAKLHKTRA